MKPQTRRSFHVRQVLLTLLVLLIGGVLAAVLLLAKKPAPGESHAHSDHAAASNHDDHDDHEGDHATGKSRHEGKAAARAKGPHGGRLFTQDGYGLELTIFETGVEPQLRIYTYRDGKPLDPAQSEVGLTLQRLGRKAQTFGFTKERDYLKGNAAVEEPLSFAVTIDARHAGKAYRFAFEQVEARVTMSDAQLQGNGVQLATAGPARIKVALQLLGEVRLNEDRAVHVVPRLAGLVESVPANAGDRVRRGQVLAVVSSQALADQRSELRAARQRLELARMTNEREKQLWEEKISARQDYQQASQALAEAQIAEQSARQKLASLGAGEGAAGLLTRYEIRAPIDGVITDKKISVGEVLKEDSNIFVVADLSSVWVEMTVQAKDLNAVRPGQKATVRASAFEARADGTVAYVGALVGEQTRAARARVVLPNPKGVWRPGLAVTVELVAEEVEVPLAISAAAVQTLRDAPVVFGRYGDKFEARPVKLGRSDGQTVEVLGGLEAGERYAARNSFLIKADIGKAGASHDH